MYASSSKSQISLRVLSTHRFFRTITVTLDEEYEIFKILLSGRGYIVVQIRSACNRDILAVYSINGVKIVEKLMNELLNVIILEPVTEYFVITGGTQGVVKQLAIITLLHEELPFKFNDAGILMIDFLKSPGRNKLVVGYSNNKVKYLQWSPTDSK